MDSASSFTLADSPIRHKRARVSRACDQCRRKKIRCDADKSTPCTNCRTYGFGCSFLDSAKKRGPPKGYIEALENRLKRMEGLLGGLVDGVDKGTRPKKTSNRELDDERRRRKKGDENEEGAAAADDDDDDEEEDDAEDDDEDDADDDNDSASSSHSSSRGRNNEYRRQRRRNDVSSSATKPAPLTGVDFSSKFQHLNALSSPPQTPEEIVEDLNENLEKLDMEEYTHIRYVGNSSGLHLLTPQFENKDGIFKLPQMGPPTSSDPAQYVQVKKEPDCGDLGDGDDLEPGLEDLKNRLIDIYFAKVHVIYPIINKLHFLKQFHGDLSTRPSHALTNAMLAMAARYLPEDEPEGTPEALGQKFFDRAKDALDQIYMHPRVSTVQALLLLALFQNGVAEASRHWLDCGLAIRMAQELGLHRSSSKWKIPKSEIEARKRLWWACFVMDRWFSATFGRPLVISEDDCDVEYPSIFEEEDDELFSPISRSHGSFSPEPLLRNSPPVKKPAYRAFLGMVKLSETLGHVLQALYTPKARKRRSANEKTVKGLDEELAAWWADLPLELQWQKDDSHNVVSSPIIGSINLCYYTVLILIHRPHIPKTSNLRSVTPLRTCTSAASNITKIVQCMNANKYFDLTWPFSVYNIFQSSLIHMYNDMSQNQDIARTASSGLASNIQILEALQYTSFQARKLSLLLGALSKKEVNFDEPQDGGFWVTVNATSKSPASSGSLSPKLVAKTPSTRSSYPSYTTPSTRIASQIVDPHQHNRFSTSNAGSPMTSNADVSIPLPVPPHVLSHTSLPMSSPSPNLVTLQQPEPAFSLRPFAFASQPDFQRPVTQPPPDDNMTFALDSNGGNGEMPNEYFRVESNPFYAMPSTYNVEDWDVWMVEHGSAGTMNVG